MPLQLTPDRVVITDSPFPMERNLGIAMLGIGTGIELAMAWMVMRAEPGAFNMTAVLGMMATVPIFIGAIAFVLKGRAMTRVTFRRGADVIDVERIGMFRTTTACLPGEALRGVALHERTRDTVEPLYEAVLEIDGLPPLSVAVDASRPAAEAERRRIEWQIAGALVRRAAES
ncbi:MAG: hypothetical protein R3D02_00290 [Hyphomicrobiales bacterium]